jgi:predicted MPP superfamily phosphohydrolase
MSSKAALVVAFCSLFDALVAAWLLFRVPRSRIGPGRVAVATLALSALLLIKMFGAVAIGNSYFLAINLAYTDLMVVVPLLAIATLVVARTRDVALSARGIACASLLLVPIAIDATFIEPFRLVTERTDVPIARRRKLSKPLVVAVMADIQLVEVTDHERDAVARVMAAKPDLILLPGDLQQIGFDRFDELIPQLRELFAPLSAPLGVWYVEGNCESTEEARLLLAGTPVKVLYDEIVHFDRDGDRVTLCGVDLHFGSPAAKHVLREIENASGDDDVRILLAHRPDVVMRLAPKTRVDLVIAGHTHGGQVQIPFFGPPITLSRVSREIAAGGLHETDRRRIYVSRGIGWEHDLAPRVRFLCPPEVSVLTLQRPD